MKAPSCCGPTMTAMIAAAAWFNAVVVVDAWTSPPALHNLPRVPRTTTTTTTTTSSSSVRATLEAASSSSSSSSTTDQDAVAAAAAAEALAEVDAQAAAAASTSSTPSPPFRKILAANRAEIAVRIMRAATELNAGTVAIYAHEDRYGQHRWGADQSFLLDRDVDTQTPIQAYLDIDQIIGIARAAGVEAIHPGYGFLSESPEFAQACAANNITFVGPTVENLERFADKTRARQAAIDAGVPVVPGSNEALKNPEQVIEYVESIGLPVILKAAMGGGGKGMRVVRSMDDLIPFYEAASSEALASFGDGSVFVERFVDRPKHIEVQIVGDGTGNVVHLWERDCSVQRKHQKVLEMAPAWTLPMELRHQLHQYAVQITSAANYKNAGTVEFLVDKEMRPYFIEVNPRIQVEHTVTEEVTGVDLVQAQIKIAAGATLEEAGLVQSEIQPRGVALQCRVTTENPEREFAPDTGTISLYRHSAGKGVRMDGIGYSGLTITPYFDSMIVKYTAVGATFLETVQRMKRVLQECRIRGVQTNIGFLLNTLQHPEFLSGAVTTSLIDENPQLLKTSTSTWDFANEEQSDSRKLYATERLIRYLANLAVNGHPPELGADPTKLTTAGAAAASRITAPQVTSLPDQEEGESKGWRQTLLEKGPEGFAKAVRDHSGLLLMDTTWRDAHQSLLATRMRTQDLLQCADYTNAALAKGLFSTEMWGGATFDVAMRFLREDPWGRLERLRAKVPDVPFQMLLRGANAVGYTNYADNVVYRFCAQAQKSGIDVFRVFDSLNYLENLKLGVDAAGKAGGVVEGTLSYTGDVSDPNRGKYNLEYYVKLARDLVDMGVHTLAIKDMAGLLTPKATTLLVSTLRKEHPDVPIHVHTHDTAGTGVASMLAAAQAGADVVDAAMDAMSGLTSQPSLGALVANVRGTELDTGLDLSGLGPLNAYWENVRSLYAPFESGQLSGSSDVYFHEIPGGQYTNLLYQSKQLGLTERWTEIKQKYAMANHVLGDIPKVTPSSKVVGDLAQFMVAQSLEVQDVMEQAETLAFPDSVVNYLRGDIGVPPGGFPEPLRSQVLQSRGLEPIEGRPGQFLEDYNFEKVRTKLEAKFGSDNVSEKDLLSYALYPNVYTDWKEYRATLGEVGKLPTHLWLNPMKVGEEVEISMGGPGKDMLVKLVTIEDLDPADGSRNVLFEVNGEQWYMTVSDLSEQGERMVREKVGSVDEDSGVGQVGAPMSGVVVGLKVKAGDVVLEGETVATLSAMKMESSLRASVTGKVSRVLVHVGDKVDADDLIIEIEEGPAPPPVPPADE